MPYTINQHFAFGNIVKRAHQSITDELLERLQKSYAKTSPEMRACRSTLKALDRLKCVMDDAICGENFHHPSCLTNAYYGEPLELLDMEGFAVIDRTTRKFLTDDDKDALIFPTAEEAHQAGQALGHAYQITDLSTASIVR